MYVTFLLLLERYRGIFCFKIGEGKAFGVITSYYYVGLTCIFAFDVDLYTSFALGLFDFFGVIEPFNLLILVLLLLFINF